VCPSGTTDPPILLTALRIGGRLLDDARRRHSMTFGRVEMARDRAILMLDRIIAGRILPGRPVEVGKDALQHGWTAITMETTNNAMVDRLRDWTAARDLPIVVAVDGSPVSYQAAAWAATEAALHGCRIEVVAAALPGSADQVPLPTGTHHNRLGADAEKILSETVRVARAAVHGAVIDPVVMFEPTIAGLLDRSRRARLLVVGCGRPATLRRGQLGSVTAAMIRHARCPVTVVHATPETGTASPTDKATARKPVLVGVDGSSHSVPAIELAFEEASLRKVGLAALHAWSDTGDLVIPSANCDMFRDNENALLAESLAGYQEKFPDVPVRRILVRDQPVRSLIGESQRAQLLVVGGRGLGIAAGMPLGSTSYALTQAARCPIIVVREEDPSH
jgi:nucleotide-binding universal stress UspA family protein